MKSSFTRLVRAALGGLVLCLLPTISRAVGVNLTYGTPQHAPAPASPEFGVAISIGSYWDANGETAQDYISSYKIVRQNIQLRQSSIPPYTSSLNYYFQDPNSLGAGVHAYAVYVDGEHPEAYDRWIEGYDEDEIDENGDVTGWHHVDAHREVGFDWSGGTIGAGTIQFIIGDATPVIVSSPQPATANIGGVATFTVVASGNGVWVNWERLPAGGGTWSNFNLSSVECWVTALPNQAPGSVLNVRATSTSMHGDQFRAVVINPAGSVTSASATLTVTVPHVVFSGGDAIAVSYVSAQQSAGPTNAAFSILFSGATTSYTAADGETASDQLTGYTIGRPTGLPQAYSLNYTNRLSNGDYQVSYYDLVTLTLGVYTYWVGLQAWHPEAFDRWVEAYDEDEYDEDGNVTGWHHVDAHREIGFDWSYEIVASTAVPFYVGVAPGAPVAPPTIVVQPAPKTLVFSGGSLAAAFSCSVASELMADLKWQRRPAGGAWADLAAGGDYAVVTANNRSTLTLTVTVNGLAANGDEFRCVASNAAGSVTSGSAVLSVYTIPVFVTQPPDRGGIANTPINVSFTAGATGQPAPSYQWQRSVSGSWIDLANDGPYSGANTSTLTYNGYYGSSLLLFRCVASNAAGGAISRVALLQPQTLPSFAGGQPQSQTISAPSPTWPIMTYFTANASGTPAPTLQWQRLNPDSTWSNLANGGPYSGVNSVWLYVSGTVASLGPVNMFRCVATNSAGSTPSNMVSLAISMDYPLGFYVQPQSRTVPPGCSATFTATAGGTPAPTSYEWQRLVDTQWQDLGAYGSTLTVSNTTFEMNGSQYRCRVYNGTTRADSIPATLTVDPNAPCAPVIYSPTAASGNMGSPFSYTIQAYNTPASFGATGLPSGLAVTGTGVISGTPMETGTFPITLSATNSGGTGSATLSLTVAEANGRVLDRNMYDRGGGSGYPNPIPTPNTAKRYDGDNRTGTSPPDPEADAIWNSTAGTYLFFTSTLSMQTPWSLSGTDFDEIYYNIGGDFAQNMSWDTRDNRMRIGAGVGADYRKWGFQQDIIAHELGHGANNTAVLGGLIYSGNSGSLDEALADFWGCAYDTYLINSGRPISQWQAGDPNFVWQIGEGLPSLLSTGTAIRRIYDPHAIDDTKKDFYDGNPLQIYGNSTTISLALKLLVTGGQHPRASTFGRYATIPALGWETVMKAVKTALSRAAPGVSFEDFRNHLAIAAETVDAANGGGSRARTAVHLAFDLTNIPNGGNNLRPINMSTLGTVSPGHPMITGFTLGSGAGSKKYLLRGIGPSLTTRLNVAGASSDPKLWLYDVAGNQIAYNDDWDSALSGDFQSMGAFSLDSNSKDAALAQQLAPGLYSAVVDGSPGNALVEIYDSDLDNTMQLTNLSTRGYVTSSSPLRAGLVIQGAGKKRVLIRAVGPALTNFGIADALPHPTLRVTISGLDSMPIFVNDGWSSFPLAAQISTTTNQLGAFPLASGSADSAVLADLPAGTYNIAMGTDGSPGVGLIEVYVVDP